MSNMELSVYERLPDPLAAVRSLGLAIAILFNDWNFPFKKLIRSLLIIPYTVPALITILI